MNTNLFLFLFLLNPLISWDDDDEDVDDGLNRSMEYHDELVKNSGGASRPGSRADRQPVGGEKNKRVGGEKIVGGEEEENENKFKKKENGNSSSSSSSKEEEQKMK